MPYRQAHYLVGLVFIITVVGFWPSYFSSLAEAPPAFHFHGITASAWILLVGFQSWSIHRRHRKLHRSFGIASLFLFPLLVASFVMIVNVSASVFKNGNPFYLELAPVFAYGTLIPFVAYLILYGQALRHRRAVHLHAGYLLATPFLLVEPAAARLIVDYVPPMAVTGPADFSNATDAIAIGIAVALPFAVYLYLRDRKHGTPFLIVAMFMVAQIAGLYWIADTETWRALFAAYAELPRTLTVGAGFALGVLAAWLGWQQPASAKETKGTVTLIRSN